MRTKKTKLTILLASCLYTLSSGFPVLADDIDIFVGNPNTTGTASNNVLLIIDNSYSMHNAPQCTGNNCPTTAKIQIVKDVLNDLLSAKDPNDPTKIVPNPNFKGTNFAIMDFNRNELNTDAQNGGKFVSGFTKLDDQSLSTLTSTINSITTDYSTPLAETLYEATRFYLGMKPKYGNTASATALSAVKDINGYYTPSFDDTCGATNHIVLLTDGMPRSDNDANSLINDLPNYGAMDPNNPTAPHHDILTCDGKTSPSEKSKNNKNTSTDCLPLVSEYLYKHQFKNNMSTSNVITHTIAFDINEAGTQELLNDTATDCDAQKLDPTGAACTAYTATDYLTLQNAFNNIFTTINDSATTFTNAAVSIGSKLYHDNQAYFAMFKPDMRPRWQGNLKGYQILDTTETGKVGKDYYDFNSPPNPILDNNGNIKDDTLSKWGTTNDGSDITKGGAEEKIPTTRQVYTYVGGLTGLSINAPATLDTLSKTIDRSYFGAADNTERDNLVQWALGEELYDDDGDPNTPMVWRKRHVIGDPLHSQPVIVNYTDKSGITTSYTFFGTNDGFLHAVNLTTGEEKFAFIPKELLPNLKTYLTNPEMNQLQRPYGLDGEITIGQIDQKVLLFFGMRRGGKNYYALDISNLDAPKLVWQITGGVSGTDFAELGQTWSKPLFAKVNFTDPNGKIVLIIGGGYDTHEDDPANTTHASGRAVYIVDASNGQRLWWAHGSGISGTRTQSELVVDEMDYSIPSSIGALDVNYDDVVDKLYLVDIAGQLFRIDLDAVIRTTVGGTETVTAAPNGGRIANLRGTDPDQQRRFYNEPEIVFTNYGTYRFVRVNVGSGFRAVPLGTSIKNRFYSIRDDNVYSVPDSYTSNTEADLYNATSNHDASVINGDSKKGWYIDLPGTGEKSLSQSMTINNHLMFTTYTPPQSNASSCSPPIGSATFYMVDLLDATPQKTYPLERGGIPPAPMPLIFPGKNSANPDLEIAVGMEFIKDDQKTDKNGNPLPVLGLEAVLNKNYWEEK